MKHLRFSLILAVLISAVSAPRAQQSHPPSPQVVDLKSADGTLLKATYFRAAKPGPGVVLFHQSNRTRTSWDDVGRQLAAAGINTLAVDSRAHGESGAGPYRAPDGGVCPPQQPTLALPKVCVRALCRMAAPTPDRVK
jgi:hypothetical protein